MNFLLVVLLCGLCLGEGFFLPSNQEICANPATFQSILCQLIPPGCLRPVCATESLQEVFWFKSRCHLRAYNIRCRSKFTSTTPSLCLPELRPPIKTGFCPIPTFPRQ